MKPVTLVGSGSLSYTNSLYPPFKHNSSKASSERDWGKDDLHPKIFGYVDSTKQGRGRLESMQGQKENMTGVGRLSRGEGKASNSKLYCEFAKTALNLMSVFEAGEDLAGGRDYMPPLPNELEEQVKDIKSKYCCTEP